jgi:hypothetical protein
LEFIMSYRLITKATLTVLAASGSAIAPRIIEVRAYPSPKRDASGSLTLDGTTVSYKRTGGKGRGTSDHRYVYFPVGTESAYSEITEAEAMAFVGGSVSIASIKPTKLETIAAQVGVDGLTPALVAATVAAVEAGIAEHGLKVTDYTSGKPVDASIAPKAPRRVKAAA